MSTGTVTLLIVRDEVRGAFHEHARVLLGTYLCPKFVGDYRRENSGGVLVAATSSGVHYDRYDTGRERRASCEVHFSKLNLSNQQNLKMVYTASKAW